MLLYKIKKMLCDGGACYGGGGKGSSPTVQTVAATPPPAPPAEEAKMKEFTDPEAEKKKVLSKTQGANSLQIPLGQISGGSGIGTI